MLSLLILWDVSQFGAEAGLYQKQWLQNAASTGRVVLTIILWILIAIAASAKRYHSMFVSKLALGQNTMQPYSILQDLRWFTNPTFSILQIVVRAFNVVQNMGKSLQQDGFSPPPTEIPLGAASHTSQS